MNCTPCKLGLPGYLMIFWSCHLLLGYFLKIGNLNFVPATALETKLQTAAVLHFEAQYIYSRFRL